VCTVKTASGARAVQIVHSSRRGSRDIEHIGSAHDDAELELLQAAARQRLAAGQGELDFGLDGHAGGKSGGSLPITSTRMVHLWDALCTRLTNSALMLPVTVTRCSGAWCWLGSSIRRANSTPCGSSKRPGSAHRRTRR
jgi:hypothetical protein